ncbi:MAG: 6-carboxytetrahydropterin synthase [Verrucomicrobiota bacterium]
MPYRVCKSIEIENGHMLSKHPDKCKFPHGHTRKVEFVLEADELDDNEMVCDFKVVKQVIDDYLQTYDHAMCVNTADPMYETLKSAYGERVIGFENIDPTTEVIAKAIHDVFQAKLEEYRQLPDGRYPVQAELRIVKVRVWETSSSWAEYSA